MKSVLVQSIISAVILVGVLVGYGVWYSIVAGESGRAAELSEHIKAKTETASRASAVRATLDELAADEKIMQNYFISEQNIVSFLEGLEAVGTRLGADVQVASVAQGKGLSARTLAVSLKIGGEFDALMRTIGTLEYAPYDITVSNVVIGKNPVDVKPSWSATLTLKVGSTATSTAAVRAPQGSSSQTKTEKVSSPKSSIPTPEPL